MRVRSIRQVSPSSSQLPALGQATKAEKGLIWLLIHQPQEAMAALETLEEADIEGLASTSVLDLARKLNQDRGFSPSLLLERLNTAEAQLVTAIASEGEAHANDATECARSLKRRRVERERNAIQREIDRLQQQGEDGSPGALERLLVKKYDLIKRLEDLT